MSAPLTDSESQQLWWDSLSEEFRDGVEDARLHASEGWPSADTDSVHWSALSADYKNGYRYGQQLAGAR